MICVDDEACSTSDVAASTCVAFVGHTVALTNSVDDGFAI